MPDSHEQLFESSRGAREISSQMHSSSVNSRSALLLRENEKDKSDRSARALPEPWEYYREEWPRETLLEKMFPRFVPAGVEKEYNIFKHDHRGFLDSLRTATMMRLVALIALFFFRYISLMDSRDQAVSRFWPGVAGQFFILNLLISLVYLGVAHWTLRACVCFQKFVEIGAVIFIMHHVFYTLLDSERAAILIEFFTGWKDDADHRGPAIYDEGVAVLMAMFGLTSASLCGHLSVLKVFSLLCYTILLYFLYLIFLREDPFQGWWEYILLHLSTLALISLVIFLALRRCDIGWRHRFIQGRTVRSELAHHRKVKPFYSAQRRLLAAVFDTVFVVGGESFEIIDNDNKKVDEFFGGQMNMLGMNLLSLLGADEADEESWGRSLPNRRESEYERFHNYMRLLGSEGNNCAEPAKLINLRFCYTTESSQRRCLDVEMFGVKFDAPPESVSGMADFDGMPSEEEKSLSTERYILALRKANFSSGVISTAEDSLLGDAEADWIDTAICCRLKDRVEELKGLIKELESRGEGDEIDYKGARGLHNERGASMEASMRPRVVEEALKDVEMISSKQVARIVSPRLPTNEKRVTVLRCVEEMQVSQDCKMLLGLAGQVEERGNGLNMRRKAKQSVEIVGCSVTAPRN